MDSPIVALLYQFFVRPAIDISVLLVPVAVFGFIIRFCKNKIEDILINDIGKVPYYAFAVIGTPVHELSHLLAALVFRHKIKRFSLFSPDASGRLGYVEHAYDPQSLYQRVGCFFVGIAPLLGGFLALLLLTRLFLPRFSFHAPALSAPCLVGLHDGHSAWQAVQALAKDIVNIGRGFIAQPPPLSLRTGIYLYLALGIGSHMYPSLSDFKGMVPGVLTLYILICLFDFWFRIMHVDTRPFLEKYLAVSGFGINFMLFVILLLAACLVLLFVLKLLLRIFLKRNG
jgi:hypothetical protein